VVSWSRRERIVTITKGSKSWLAASAAVLLMPMLAISHPDKKKGCESDELVGGDKKCIEVAEGGSSIGYLLVGGTMFLGAVVVRSLRSKPVL
jgi:hypothetical protein